MSAGTLTLTNNSASVSGQGTTFTTELAAGDFILVTVGGIPYTLPVKSMDSDTVLTLVSNFTGPTQAGAAWSAIPRVALNMVTAALVAQSVEALRGLNYDKKNWQQFFTVDGDVTMTLPDNSQSTGPSAKKLVNLVSGKAAKGKNSDITELSGLTTALSIAQGGTGSTTDAGARTNLGLAYGTTAGTVAQGNDSRLNTINGKTGGQINSGISMAFGSDGTFSNAIAFDVIPNAEAVRLRGSRADFSDSTNRVILNIDSVSARKAVLYASGGIICQPGLAGGPQMFSTFLNYASGPVDLWVDSARMGAIQVVTTSDKYLKKDIKYVGDSSALGEVMLWRPASFRFKKRAMIPESEEMLGFIANDLVTVSPECVNGTGLQDGYDENDTSDAYTLDQTAMIAKLTMAIQEQQKQIEELKALLKVKTTTSQDSGS